MAPLLADYVTGLGFTHVELLPVTEHPLDDSWGYQATGYFAPTSRHGSPDDLRYFIDVCHRAGIGVLLDLGFVPGSTVSTRLVSPAGDPTAYQVRAALVALRREQARHVRIIPQAEAAA